MGVGYIRLSLVDNSSLVLGPTNDSIMAPLTRRIETQPKAKVH